jgi:signal peptidase I
MYLGPDNLRGKEDPSYKGDRILVGKFPYDFSDPERWDVAVFKYPGGAETNFIKRVVGLPEETVKIGHGDILTKREGENEFNIARKPAAKLEAMLQPVYDNDHVVPEIIQQGWPARWNPAPAPADAAGQWKSSDDFRAFRTDGSAQGEVWLRYQHFVPSFQDWDHLLRGGVVPAGEVRPQLITDFSGYNTHKDADSGYLAPEPHKLGLHWVGDLVVEGAVDVESDSGEIILELVEGGRHFQCRIDVSTGMATFSIDGLEDYHPTAKTKIVGPGGYHVRFANVDDQLLLWVNKRLVEFDQDTSYPRLGNEVPTKEDLTPVRIGSRGAALQVQHLKLRRDLYYIAVQLGMSGSMMSMITDFTSFSPPYQPMTPERVAYFLSEPREWEVFRTLREVEFKLQKDQFLMLGDNSAESKDSRLWDNSEYYVDRDLLIGKALYIYWPHSFNRIPGTGIWFPFFPNVARMGFVR